MEEPQILLNQLEQEAGERAFKDGKDCYREYWEYREIFRDGFEYDRAEPEEFYKGIATAARLDDNMLIAELYSKKAGLDEIVGGGKFGSVKTKTVKKDYSRDAIVSRIKDYRERYQNAYFRGNGKNLAREYYGRFMRTELIDLSYYIPVLDDIILGKASLADYFVGLEKGLGRFWGKDKQNRMKRKDKKAFIKDYIAKLDDGLELLSLLTHVQKGGYIETQANLQDMRKKVRNYRVGNSLFAGSAASFIASIFFPPLTVGSMFLMFGWMVVLDGKSKKDTIAAAQRSLQYIKKHGAEFDKSVKEFYKDVPQDMLAKRLAESKQLLQERQPTTIEDTIRILKKSRKRNKKFFD